MTFEQLFVRLKNRWWLIVLTTLLATLAFFPKLNTNLYQSSIGIGLNFNSSSFLSSDVGINPKAEYTESLTELSNYLSYRFSSVEVQSTIAQKLNLTLPDFDSKSPFYDVVTQSGGYISLTFENSNEELVKNFLPVVKEVYKNLILREMNEQVLQPFQITPKDSFIETFTTVTKPIQLKVLPTIAGLLSGILLAIIWPTKQDIQKFKNYSNNLKKE